MIRLFSGLIDSFSDCRHDLPRYNILHGDAIAYMMCNRKTGNHEKKCAKSVPQRKNEERKRDHATHAIPYPFSGE